MRRILLNGTLCLNAFAAPLVFLFSIWMSLMGGVFNSLLFMLLTAIAIPVGLCVVQLLSVFPVSWLATGINKILFQPKDHLLGYGLSFSAVGLGSAAFLTIYLDESFQYNQGNYETIIIPLVLVGFYYAVVLGFGYSGIITVFSRKK